MCTPKCINNCYEDDKRETVSSFARLSVSYPKRSLNDQCLTDTCSTIYWPIKLTESILCFTCGAVLCFVPCIVCKLETMHSGTDVDIQGCRPYCKCQLPNPFRFKDKFYPSVSQTYHVNKGYQIGCSCSTEKSHDPVTVTTAESTISGYQFMMGSVIKILKASWTALCLTYSCINVIRN